MRWTWPSHRNWRENTCLALQHIARCCYMKYGPVLDARWAGALAFYWWSRIHLHSVRCWEHWPSGLVDFGVFCQYLVFPTLSLIVWHWWCSQEINIKSWLEEDTCKHFSHTSVKASVVVTVTAVALVLVRSHQGSLKQAGFSTLDDWRWDVVSARCFFVWEGVDLLYYWGQHRPQ